MAASTQFAVLTLLLLYCQTQGSYSTTFTIVSKCSSTVWPAFSSGAGTSPLSTTGFSLQPGESNAIVVPSLWSGRLWGRTLCSQDSTGNFSCVTGDFASSPVECSRSSATPLATLAEFTLNGTGGLDFFDVSLANGYNLPMMVEPVVCKSQSISVRLGVRCARVRLCTGGGWVGWVVPDEERGKKRGESRSRFRSFPTFDCNCVVPALSRSGEEIPSHMDTVKVRRSAS